LLRTIILIVFIYLCLKVVKDLIVKPWLAQKFTHRTPNDNRALFTGEMVQDPVCKVYLTKREAQSATIAGQVYYFCSAECMKKFREGKRQG
jgi:YHS domain-containing protein